MADASATVASTPTWLAFCGKMAPMSSVALYMAVSRARRGLNERTGCAEFEGKSISEN
jgi:hypothetical protein